MHCSRLEENIKVSIMSVVIRYTCMFHSSDRASKRRYLITAIVVLFVLFASSASGRRPEQSQRLRLPPHIIPVHYRLHLQPFLGANATVRGRVAIQLKVLKPSNRIRLHMADVTISQKGLRLVSDKQNSETVAIKGFRKDPRNEFLSIRVRGRLQTSTTYNLTIAFTSKLYNEPRGFYTSTYWEQDDRQRFVAATQFWPANARRSFPCFDEPGLKATFDIFLARQDHMMALSNMPCTASSPIPEQPGWYWDQFATTPPMPTYLVAFVITEFPSKHVDTIPNHRVTVWSRGEILDETDHALEVGEKALQYFEEYFGIEYSIPKMDMVALPLTAHSGMENWGIITYGETAFTYSPRESSAKTKRQSAELVTHEVAHQWFGNLVTFSWWTDLWLSEGFATYMANAAVDKMFPSWKVLDEFVVTRLHSVMEVDAQHGSHPISTVVCDPARIHEVFDEIPYSKGASIIRMMSHFLSEATLREALSLYLNTFKYKNAAQDDLWASLTEQAQKDGSLVTGMTVKLIMDSWTLQPGFPVITVERPDNSTARLKQSRFCLNINTATDKKNTTMEAMRWWIPVTFTDKRYPYFEHTRPRTWLRPQDAELTVTGLPPRDQWVIFNLQQIGYFRVNYEEANWVLLIEQLRHDHTVFPVSNRAQIVDDSLNLARAGLLSYNVALNVTRYLLAEEAYAPWLSALNNFEYLDLMLRSTPLYGDFQNYLRWLIEPMVNKIGLQENKEDELLRQLQRTILEDWACRLNHPTCLAIVDQLTGALLNRTSSAPLSRDASVGGSYCTAVRRGGLDTWQAVWELYRQTPHTARRAALGRALGCTTESWILNKYLRSGLQGADLADALRWATQTGPGQEVAWQHIWNNRHSLLKSPQVLSTLIKTLAKGFYTDQHLFMLNALLDMLNHAYRGHRADVVASAQANWDWHERSYLVIEKWLQDAGFSVRLRQDDSR